ncbi:MAG TPA: SLC13 family permease [Vicinamibacteria bacterium]|nr:SLC13 family permease [Vicinamibacteria bacterium]
MSFVVLAIGIAIVVTAIFAFDVHPFLALVLATMIVGVLSPKPLEPGGADLQAIRAVELTAQGFGVTAGGIGIVIVLAAIIGQCLLESGAADRIVRSFLKLSGDKRAGLALMGSGYVLSIPVFFDTVFFLLVPLARSLRLRTGRSYALYVSAICAGALVTHSLVPPTPGPLFMAETFELPLGTAILGGALLGLAPAFFGLAVSGWIDRRLDVPLRDVPGTGRNELEAIARRDASELPGLFVSLLPVAVPVGLISIHSILEASLRPAGRPSLQALLDWSGFFGDKNMALLAGSFIAAWLLRRTQSLSVKQLGQGSSLPLPAPV